MALKNVEEKQRQRAPSKRSLATRARILDAAERVFAERGYEGASIRDIATAADDRRLLNELLVEVVAGSDAARLFDLDAVLCPGGESMESVGDVDVLRTDGLHFSVDGALWLAETHGPELVGLDGP